ncbi:hypothetical protein ACHAPJ_002109 [Fusarium lateritium]
MKSVVLSVLASGAAAQITMPLAGLGLGPELFQNAAINPSDPEYATCEQAVSIVQDCVSQVGGVDAAATADPTALVACACCDGRSNNAPIYSACSGYLSEEAPENTSQYQAYGTLYNACKLVPKCTGGSGSASGSNGGSSVTRGSGGGSGDNDSSASAGGSRPTATTTEEDDTATITTSPAEQTYASACVDMLSIFTSCSKKDREFTALPFKEQAECYCCRGSGTRLTWTDAMDNYASTCADWARTGEPDTAYNVAKTFATFCNHFTDVCSIAAARTSESEATATEDSGSRQTEASSGDDSNSDATTSENNQGPVTVTVQPTTTESSDSGNDASSARVGFGAVLVAVAALAIAL